MKNLFSKLFPRPKTQDEIALQIQRLCDPTYVGYDPEFAQALQEEHDKRKKK